jgi:hypothetical protein
MCYFVRFYGFVAWIGIADSLILVDYIVQDHRFDIGQHTLIKTIPQP